ncbi:MAG: POTRA domain-containing protein, partial [Rikenellaceae bacterium]
MKRINCVRAILLAVFMSTISIATYAQDEQKTHTADSIEVTKELNTMDYVRPGRYTLKDVRVHGVKYVDPELIINAAGLVRGDEIDIPGDYISSAIRKLWSQRFYSDIKVYVSVEGVDAIIDIYMKERPRISRWEFTGVKSGEEKQLRDKLKLTQSELSDYVLHGTTNNIKAFFEEKGYLNTTVDITQRNDTLQKLKQSFVVLTFNIDKGEKMKLKEINFEGNEALSAKKLKGSLKDTKEKTLINMFKTAKFNRKKFEADKDNLIDYMQSKGYRNAAVLEDSLYQISDNRLGLKIKVVEGNKYYFRNISFTGNVKYPTDQLQLILGIQRGDVYDKKTLESRLGTDQKSAMEGSTTVSSIYNNTGHLAFQIDPVETVISGDSIDMDIRISEGKPFTVNEVRIIGNTRTTDRVIRRELLTRPGELYNQEMLINSLRQVQAMGHFTDNMNPVPIPVSDGLVDIELNLEERPNDQFELSGGWGGGVFVASVGVTFNNVAMRNFFKKSAWRPYPTGDNQKLSLRVQTNGAYYQSYQASFFEPWLGGKKPNSFSVSAHYSSESNGNWYRGDKGDGSFATTGITLSYGKRLSWPDPNFVLSGSIEYQAYLLHNWDYFLIKDDTSNIITLSGQLERNSVDHPIYPRNGSQLSVRLSMTPPYSVFRPKDFYDDPNLTDRKAYKWVEYYQVDAN